MPYFDFTCETCGSDHRAWRPADSPPRFCCAECRNKSLSANRRSKPAKWIITAEKSEQIRKAYLGDTGNGQIGALSRRIGIPRWKISRYAITMGWTAKHRKEPIWSGEELRILERHAHRTPENIAKKLKKAGFSRTYAGIVIKRKRMRFLQNLKGQSAWSLAKCFGVDVHFILRAIRDGRLRAKRRGTARVEANGGDMWFIKDKWVRRYVLENVHEIDFRKVDKYWVVDLLTQSA